MGPVSGIVLYAVIWFMVLFVVLPLRLTTQDETGCIVPGTPAGAPSAPRLKRRLIVVTVAAAVVWVVIAGIIVSDAIAVRDLDWSGRQGEVRAQRTGG